MRIINWDEIAAGACFKNEFCAITAGVFDGVHRGHQELLKRILSRSAECTIGAHFCGSTRKNRAIRSNLFGSPKGSPKSISAPIPCAELGTAAVTTSAMCPLARRSAGKAHPLLNRKTEQRSCRPAGERGGRIFDKTANVKRVPDPAPIPCASSGVSVASGGYPALTPVIVTFRENPRRLLFPAKETMDIISLDEKLALFERAGIAACILIDFTPAFAAQSGEDFIRSLLVNANMRYMAVGANFHCGSGGSFSAAAIKVFVENFDCGGAAAGSGVKGGGTTAGNGVTAGSSVAANGSIEGGGTAAGSSVAANGSIEGSGAVCEIVPPVMDGGEPVSSSRIRAALAAGDRQLAARLLGER